MDSDFQLISVSESPANINRGGFDFAKLAFQNIPSMPPSEKCLKYLECIDNLKSKCTDEQNLKIYDAGIEQTMSKKTCNKTQQIESNDSSTHVSDTEFEFEGATGDVSFTPKTKLTTESYEIQQIQTIFVCTDVTRRMNTSNAQTSGIFETNDDFNQSTLSTKRDLICSKLDSVLSGGGDEDNQNIVLDQIIDVLDNYDKIPSPSKKTENNASVRSTIQRGMNKADYADLKNTKSEKENSTKCATDRSPMQKKMNISDCLNLNNRKSENENNTNHPMRIPRKLSKSVCLGCNNRKSHDENNTNIPTTIKREINKSVSLDLNNRKSEDEDDTNLATRIQRKLNKSTCLDLNNRKSEKEDNINIPTTIKRKINKSTCLDLNNRKSEKEDNTIPTTIKKKINKSTCLDLNNRKSEKEDDTIPTTIKKKINKSACLDLNNRKSMDVKITNGQKTPARRFSERLLHTVPRVRNRFYSPIIYYKESKANEKLLMELKLLKPKRKQKAGIDNN